MVSRITAPLRTAGIFALVALLTGVLAACGGGGDSTSTAATAPTATMGAAAPTATANTVPSPTTPATPPTHGTATAAATGSPGSTGVVNITGGKTEIEFDDKHEDAIDNANVSFKAIDPSEQDGPHEIDLIPSGGSVDPQALSGSIEHDGGFELSTSQGSVQFTDIIVDLDKAEMTGMMDGQRVTIFDLDLSDTEHGDHDYEVDIDDVDGSFATEVSKTLNDTLGVDVFGPDLKVEMELQYNPR